VRRRVAVTPTQVLCIAGAVDLLHGLWGLVRNAAPMTPRDEIEFGLIALLLAGLFAGVRRCRTVPASRATSAEIGEQ
jgi:hypothetical protein